MNEEKNTTISPPANDPPATSPPATSPPATSPPATSPPADWERARPELLPKPTYWPFFLTVGLGFIFWGMLTTWIIGGAGFLIFIIALIGWINLLRHDGE